MGKKSRKAQRPAALAESIPPTGMVDPDDWQYRSLSTRVGTSGLPDWQQTKQLEVARYLDRTNPTARRILDLMRDFVFGEGFSLSCANDQVEQLLDAHWHDPINRWDQRGPRWFRTLLRDGELLAVCSVNPVNGVVRWGSIAPHRIKAVTSDPANWEVLRTIALNPEKAGDPDQTLPVANVDLRTGHYDAGDGSCMFFKLNDDGGRGVSFLYPLADMLDALDQAVFNEVERAALLKAFFLDVTVKGAQPDEINRMVATEPRFRQPPKPGSMRVHNDNELWAAVTPSLNAGDGSEFVRLLLNYIVGTAGIPLHWIGFGGDANRATAATMDTPTIKMLTTMQDMWREMLTDLLRFTVDMAVQHGQLPAVVERQTQDASGATKGTGDLIDPREAFAVQAPDMDAKDIAQISAAFAQAMGGILTAHQEHYISLEMAQQTTWALLSQLGVEIDPKAELDRIQTEQEAEQQQQSQQQQAQAQLLQLAQRNPGNSQPQPSQQPPAANDRPA